MRSRRWRIAWSEPAIPTYSSGTSDVNGTLDETLDTRPPVRPAGLVVVASLVDKIPNLAGLARTCEVLGAEALVIGDAARTVSHRDFTAVSVTAERWLPIRDARAWLGVVPAEVEERGTRWWGWSRRGARWT